MTTDCKDCTYNAAGLCLVGYSKPSRCAYYRPACPDCKRPMTDYGRGFECEPCEYARSLEPGDAHYYKSP